MNKKLFSTFFISILLVVLLSFLVFAQENIRAPPEFSCCQKYNVDYEAWINSDRRNEGEETCCEYTENLDECLACIQTEYIINPPIKANLELDIFDYMPWFLYLLFGIFLLSLVLLIANGISILATKKKRFLTEGWITALWVIFALSLSLTVFVFLISYPAF